MQPSNQSDVDRCVHDPGADCSDSVAEPVHAGWHERRVDLGHGGDRDATSRRAWSTRRPNAVTRNLPLTEIGGGSYTATWDGRDNFGNFAGANNYRIEVYASGGTVRYYPTRTITVNAAVFAISASPDPFTPNGTQLHDDHGAGGSTADRAGRLASRILRAIQPIRCRSLKSAVRGRTRRTGTARSMVQCQTTGS